MHECLLLIRFIKKKKAIPLLFCLKPRDRDREKQKTQMAIKGGGGDGNGGKESEDMAAKIDKQRVPFYKLFTFADKFDLFFMTMGTIGAVGNGLAQPLMTIIFGKLINSFGSSDPSKVVDEVAKVCIFVFCNVL